MTLFHLCGKQNHMRKLQTKLKKLTNRSWSVSWEYRILKIRQLIVGWINYYWIGNFMGVCRKLDKQIKFRIRMCLWKKWKTNKSRKATNKIRVLPWQAKT
ncbi:MAG: group II intron maturase-specific domain-containing protein [Thomasclavelia ramosa]